MIRLKDADGNPVDINGVIQQAILQSQKKGVSSDWTYDTIEVNVEVAGMVKGFNHNLGRMPKGFIIAWKAVLGSDVAWTDDNRNASTDRTLVATFSHVGKYGIAPL